MKKLSRKGLKIKSKHDSRMAFSQKQTLTRGDVEGFISQNFYESYGANVSYFSQVLVSCKNQHDKLMAAFGITKLSQDKIYLEQYLTNPIEVEISTLTGKEVKRDEIVELGNLAAVYPGATRELIQMMATDLYDLGARWVVFTANNLVINAFQRLNFKPIAIKAADPNLLPNQGAEWGTYYQDEPKVMFLEVPQPHKYAQR